MIKRIEDWNYYELLSVERTASQDEIWEAYQAALATYQPASLAVYGLVTEEERVLILERIREAFQTLRDPKTRKEYDLALLKHAPYYAPKATFRRSIGKLEIDDAPAAKGLWAWIKRLFGRRKRPVDLSPLDDQRSLTMSSSVPKAPSGPAEDTRKDESDNLS